MATEQVLFTGQTINAVTRTFTGDFPAGTDAVKLEIDATFVSGGAGELDLTVTLYDSDDGVSYRWMGELECHSGRSGSAFVARKLKPHYKVDCRVGTRTTVNMLKVTYYQPGEIIQ